MAITILTDVTHNSDGKLVNQIKNRNRFFKSKSLEPIWFIENAEQSIDMEHRVIHLWEAELDLAVKTPEDVAWEEILGKSSLKESLFGLFNYFHRKSPASYNVQSLYYVHSADTNIVFTVQRFIKDEEQYPFRAFALNEGYQISLSTALLATQTLQLSNPEIEKQQRDHFIRTVKLKEAEYVASQQEKQREKQRNIPAYSGKSISSKNHQTDLQSNRVNGELHKISKVKLSNENEFRAAVLNYIQIIGVASATEISEYLVSNGASSERFLTGRYKIYVDVCRCLDSLAKEGVLELVKKDFVNDRVYSVLTAF